MNPLCHFPEADGALLTKLLEILGGAEAWNGVNCTSAGNHGEWRPGGPPDRLEPVFDSNGPSLGLGNGPLGLHRVHVPCGGSRIYFLHLEGNREWGRDEIEAALAASPDCLVVSLADGFGNTGLIGEYFRDRGRKQGAHHEILVWSESIATQGRHVYLMAEADPKGLAASRCPASLPEKGKEGQ